MGIAASATLLEILLLLTASAVLLLLVDLEITAAGVGGSDGCDSPLSSSTSSPHFTANFTTDLNAVFHELISQNWLSNLDRAVICVGPGSGRAAAAMRRLGFRAASVSAAAAAGDGGGWLPFPNGSFDFAFSAAVDRVRVPARVVLEMERIIRPGRFGAVFRRCRFGPLRPDGLMKTAAPVAALLRSSDVVGARTVNGSAMVVFRKRGDHSGEELTKLPLVLDMIIDQVRAIFPSEIIDF